MSQTPPKDLLFLQHLYGQDTLYLVPEAQAFANQPVPAQVALVEQQSGPSIANKPAEVEKTTNNPPVAAQITPPSPDQLPQEGINWLGEAVKGTYLLFAVSPEVFVELPQHLFLQKVLAAVGLGSLEVKFGNLSIDKTFNVKQIAQAQQARHILVFGDDLPIENLQKLEPYRMYKLEETRFVRVHSLTDIEQNNTLKAKLWEVLQKIFLQ